MVAVGGVTLPVSFSPASWGERLRNDCALTPVMASELEFYLHGVERQGLAGRVLDLVRDAAAKESLPIRKVEKERGPDQYEVSFAPTPDLEQLAHHTQRFKYLMHELFVPRGVTADFSAKPAADVPGSGLHVHLHLEDSARRNVFTRAGDEMDDPFSPALLHALGGLLALMNPCMKLFAPSAESYGRFVPHSNAPLTVSWGTNNRTVALRLPAKPLHNKHIEHRVAGSDADVAKVLCAVLAGVHHGLAKACDPGPPVYGDAGLPMYRLAPLCRTLSEAENAFRETHTLRDYFPL